MSGGAIVLLVLTALFTTVMTAILLSIAGKVVHGALPLARGLMRDEGEPELTLVPWFQARLRLHEQSRVHGAEDPWLQGFPGPACVGRPAGEIDAVRED